MTRNTRPTLQFLALLLTLSGFLCPTSNAAQFPTGKVEPREGFWQCEGQLHLPEGYPTQESPVVEIRYWTRGRTPGQEERVEQIVSVGKDGSFKLQVPMGAHRPWLFVSANHTPIIPVTRQLSENDGVQIQVHLELGVLWKLRVQDAEGNLIGDSIVSNPSAYSSTDQITRTGPGLHEWILPVGSEFFALTRSGKDLFDVHTIPASQTPGVRELSLVQRKPALLRARLMIPEGYRPGKFQVNCTQPPPDGGLGQSANPLVLPFLPVNPSALSTEPSPPQFDWVISNMHFLSEEDGYFELQVPSGRDLRMVLATEFGLWTRFDLEAMAPGEVSPVIEVPVEVGPFFSARVVDAEGEPIAGAQVRGLSSWATHNSLTPWFPTTPPFSENELLGNGKLMVARGYHHQTKTNSNGKFTFRIHKRIRSVPIEVFVDDGAVPKWQLYPAVPCGDEEALLVFTPEPHELAGRVVDSQGEPVSNCTIRISPMGGRPNLSPWEPRPGEDESDNPPVSWNEVFGHGFKMLDYLGVSKDADFRVYGPPHAPTMERTFSNEEGLFSFSGVPAGEWKIEVQAFGLPPQAIEQVQIPQKEPIEIALGPLGTIEVVLARKTGEPIVGQEVSLHPLSKPLSELVGRLPIVSSDEEGRASWTDLASGSYRIIPSGVGVALFDRMDYSLASGEKARLSPTILSLGNLRGRILWEGAPYPTRIHLHYGAQNPLGMHDTLFDQDFVFQSMRTGTYVLEVVGVNGRELPDHLFPRRTVVIKEGQTTDITLRPRAGYCVCSGVVTIDGKPATTGAVEIKSVEGSASKQVHSVAKDGTYLAILPNLGEYWFSYNPERWSSNQGSRLGKTAHWVTECLTSGLDLHVVLPKDGD